MNARTSRCRLGTLRRSTFSEKKKSFSPSVIRFGFPRILLNLLLSFSITGILGISAPPSSRVKSLAASGGTPASSNGSKRWGKRMYLLGSALLSLSGASLEKD